MSEDDFDEAGYRNALIKGGIAPADAMQTARATAQARRESAKISPINEKAYAASLEASGVDPETATRQAKIAATRIASGSFKRVNTPTPAQPGLFGDDAAAAPAGSEAADPAPKKLAQKKAPTLPATIERKPNTKPATPSQIKLIATAAAIDQRELTGDDMGFMHAIMCQVGLPRAKVAGTEFERMCGGAALNVSAGKLWDGQNFVQQPIPYGPMPRLMLAWMNTYAVRHRTPEIAIGDSASEFLRMLGKKASGGKTGTYTSFRKQLQALAAARMTIGFNANGKANTYDGKPIKHLEAWMRNTEEQMALWPGVVTFSEDYYQTLLGHAVPLNFHDYKALAGSALAMDIYTMLADRLHRISGRPLLLHWANLRDQFGQEYKGKDADKDFKKKFLVGLNKVVTVYEKANVKQVTGGLLLLPSPPPIPYKPK